MFMAFFDMVLVIFMMVPASILCEAPTGYTDQGDCDPVESSSDLGSPDALSSEGLIAGSFTNNNNNGVADPLLVRIRDYKIVCEVAGLSKGKIRGISVITTYDCMGSVCGPLGVTRVTSQFNFYCNFPDLTLVIEEVGRNEHPIGTTETPLVTTCGRCASYNRARVTQALYYKNDTNCYRCHSECNEGQRRCLGYDLGMCCNWYFDGVCQIQCPLFFRGNPETFICEPIDNPVLCYTSSECTLLNGNDQAVVGSYSLQNETATCCTTPGYDSFSIAETERCISCVDIKFVAPITPTPAGARVMKSCDVECTVGIFAGVIVLLGALWGAAAAVGYTFTRMTSHRP